MRDDSKKLEKILDCIEKIEKYASAGMINFLEDEKTQDAIVRNFHVIGEAVKDLSVGLSEQNPHVPWRDVARFRDRVAHDYFDLDMNKVWGIIETDLPSFKNQITHIISSLK